MSLLEPCDDDNDVYNRDEVDAVVELNRFLRDSFRLWLRC
jgi:hypothetical protein